jgi:hypothetical protein
MWVFSLFAAALECGAAKHFLVFAAASVQQRPRKRCARPQTVPPAALWCPNLPRSLCWSCIRMWGLLVFALAAANNLTPSTIVASKCFEFKTNDEASIWEG